MGGPANEKVARSEWDKVSLPESLLDGPAQFQDNLFHIFLFFNFILSPSSWLSLRTAVALHK